MLIFRNLCYGSKKERKLDFSAFYLVFKKTQSLRFISRKHTRFFSEDGMGNDWVWRLLMSPASKPPARDEASGCREQSFRGLRWKRAHLQDSIVSPKTQQGGVWRWPWTWRVPAVTHQEPVERKRKNPIWPLISPCLEATHHQSALGFKSCTQGPLPVWAGSRGHRNYLHWALVGAGCAVPTWNHTTVVDKAMFKCLCFFLNMGLFFSTELLKMPTRF